MAQKTSIADLLITLQTRKGGNEGHNLNVELKRLRKEDSRHMTSYGGTVKTPEETKRQARPSEEAIVSGLLTEETTRLLMERVKILFMETE